MGAAEQQQFTQYPHRYGDGTLGAAIAQTRDGKDELITPVALWELDDSSGLYLPPGLSQNPRRPRVDAQLSGSKAPVSRIVRDTPITPVGTTWTDTTVLDLTTDPGIVYLAYEVFCDQPVEVAYYSDDGVHTNAGQRWEDLRVCLPGGRVRPIRPFHPQGSRGYLAITARGSVDMTTLLVTEFVYRAQVSAVKNQQALLADGLQIRDTSLHHPTSDPNHMYIFVRSGSGGGKVPISVINALDQSVLIRLRAGPYNIVPPGFADAGAELGSLTVPAVSKILITNGTTADSGDFRGLDVPTEFLLVQAQCSVAPTSGSLSVVVDNSAGGAV